MYAVLFQVSTLELQVAAQHAAHVGHAASGVEEVKLPIETK